MQITGNDIIDLQLAAAENNWRRRGYLDKIYTPAEQELIASATAPDIMVWLLWSCKEAVYKIVNRSSGARSYAPQQFDCLPQTCNPYMHNAVSQPPQLNTVADGLTTIYAPANITGSSYTGKVFHNGNVYIFNSIVTHAYIHTVAVTQHPPESAYINSLFPHSIIINISSNTKEEMYNVDNYTQILQSSGIIAAQQQVQKDPQDLPVIYDTITQQVTSVTISHHGRYLAICC
ncbi:MAG TPA: 4'-phosphopantetheinyl transferase superfamily protein [Chitinophaga sp.]|uniref:4'-phosphopantetheinyl transferase family protein n=1 Tax=Chitinophaga sp. TaxID=1869181 RepID=UPI002C110BB6|nr:4'-phosphopantetheinyl transferase superfamily protein [Chitinophaga sp.]HVI44007.1 4'-phosphopantetheinyl transferase superfamily protein [Chitinophaga sp.]